MPRPGESGRRNCSLDFADNKFQFKLSTEEELFLKRTSTAIAFAAGAGILAAVAIGIFLAGGLLKPIRRLTTASQALAQGDLNQQVSVTSEDELGQLTTTFNQMSADLVQADQQRKRITADITHDLSTPLQIISGYIEMLEEGEVSLTPQRIDIIKTEIGHLRRLVDDLSTLTQVEAGGLDIQLQPVQPRSTSGAHFSRLPADRSPPGSWTGAGRARIHPTHSGRRGTHITDLEEPGG